MACGGGYTAMEAQQGAIHSGIGNAGQDFAMAKREARCFQFGFEFREVSMLILGFNDLALAPVPKKQGAGHKIHRQQKDSIRLKQLGGPGPDPAPRISG